jgi:hypothetical protein
MDLSKVKAGDVVRFTADFVKRGDSDEDDDEKKVLEGEIGEVIDVFPDGPNLMVEAPCQLNSMGQMITGETEALVSPETIVVVIDSRDPRITSSRILEAALSPAELDNHVRGLEMPRACRAHRGLVVTALDLAGLHHVAEVVAEQTVAAWAGYVQGAGLVRTAGIGEDDRDAWMPIILLAFDHEQKQSGEGRLDVNNRRHVLWALSQFAEDIEMKLPENPRHYKEVHQLEADIVDEIQTIVRTVESKNAREWRKMVPILKEIMNDEAIEQHFEHGVVDEPEMEPLPQLPEEIPLAPEDEEPEESDAERILREWNEEMDALRKEREQLHGPYEEGKWPEEIVLEEERALPAPPPSGTPAEHPPLPAAPRLEMAPSRYDVPMTQDAPRQPHEWAEIPGGPRVPIRPGPGSVLLEDVKGRGVDQTIRVWAEPGMWVYNTETGDKGIVVGTKEGDILLVSTQSATGLPTEEVAEWDAVEVRLAPDYAGGKRLDAEELKQWRRERRNRKRREKYQKRDKDAGIVTVTARDLCLTS